MMIESNQIEEKLVPELNALGLFCFGWLMMDVEPFKSKTAMLVGNRAGNSAHKMWGILKASPEFKDGKRDPLNRWTERVVGEFASKNDATAIYPFGEKLWPFQQYAKAATGMQSSPLGLLIHPDYGLWQAFRAVLIFEQDISLPLYKEIAHPCDSCMDKPCLRACPVDAFSDNRFSVEDCRGHLRSSDTPRCMTTGCRARAACPIGTPYSHQQIQFHMQAFGGV